MTRAELIHQMALMTDEELENCILIYKENKTPEVTLFAEGGTFEDPGLENPAEAPAPQYDLSKLYNAINGILIKFDDLNKFQLLYLNTIKPVYNYLRGKGWTSEQVAGAMGNIMQESAFDQNLRGGLSQFRGLHLGNYNNIYKTPTWQNHLDYVDDWKNSKLYKDGNKNYNYLSDKYNKADHSNAKTSAAAFYKYWEVPGSKDTTLGKRQAWADILYRWFNNPVGFHKEGGELEFTNLQDLATELNAEMEPEYKQVKLCKTGSVLDLLKLLLPDPEIFDLISHFGIEDLMEGGLKNTGKTSISITIILDASEDDGEIPELKKIEIGDKSYEVEIVSTEEDMEKGLGERKSLDKDKGMLFDFGEVQEEVTFNCEEMQFPIDIIFINDDDEVIRVAENCQPGKDLFTESNVRYVLEVNANSGIKSNDELDIEPEDNTPVMKVLAPDGSTQMELLGGERIFSRIKTKLLIKWAKRAEKSKKESDYKHLGKIMFAEIAALDDRPAEYVEVPEN